MSHVETIARSDSGEVVLRLSDDAAIVLFELLSRWSDPWDLSATPDPICFENASECAVLHDVRASLEARLASPFQGNYREAIVRAHRQLGDRWTGSNLRG